MTFTREANTLTSADGRFRIEGMRDHRGISYSAWDTQPLVDWGWMFLCSTQSAEEAKTACEQVAKFGVIA